MALHFHWSMPVIVIGVPSLYLVTWYWILARYKLHNILLTVLFIVNIFGEAIATTRGQFNTTLTEKVDIALGVLLTAIGIIGVTIGDIYLSLKNHMPMGGKRKLIQVNPPILAPPNVTWYEKFEHGLKIIWETLKHSSFEDRVRIIASIGQFLFRLAEYISRLLCTGKACAVLSNSISAVPIFLAVFCFAKRIFRKFDRPQDTISCILVGDFRRIADAIRPPQSDLLARSMNFTNRMAKPVARTFDIWSSRFTPIIGRRMKFTLMELRCPHRPQDEPANEEWYFPPADFVILHFSVTDRASYNAIKNGWVAFVEKHNKGSRVIMVGTNSDAQERQDDHVSVAEGYELAYQANAVSYFEMRNFSDNTVADLFSKIVALID